MIELDAVNRALLEHLQSDFPLIPRSFAALGRALDLDEDTVLARVRRLKCENVIRQIGAIFDTRRLGYQSTLVAFHVQDGEMETVGLRCATLPEVLHCYQRPAYPPRRPYTLFAMIHGQMRDEVESIVDEVVRETGIGECRVLYSTHEFK